MKGTILRWSLVLALVAILAMFGAPLAARPAAAATIRIPIDNYNVNCVILSQTTPWVEDGILHIRDRVMSGVVESDGPYHQGTGHMVANANIDLATLYGSYWGTLEIYPDAYPDGHWAGSFAMQVNEGRAAGIARLQGYGSLNGLATKSDLVPLTPAQLADYAYLCSGKPISGAHAVGFVMDPGGE
ncbi:MAG: hypothetical protein ACP5JJ_06695 [Anaerolineae bacterium]